VDEYKPLSAGKRRKYDEIPEMAMQRTVGLCSREQSDKLSYIDVGDDHIDNIISHIISPYPISISTMIISIWLLTILIYHIPYR
jgi:hypothetical protein